MARKASAKALSPDKGNRFAGQKEGRRGWNHRERALGTDVKVRETIG